MIELRHLRAFCVVAEEGHVTRAAQRLNIAQPALTQQIRALEAELGVALFRRVGRGVEITQAGRYLQKESLALLDHVRTICEKTREAGGKGSRSITVALTDVETLEDTVTDLLRRYRELNPDVLVRELMLEPQEIASALRDGRVDAAFSCAAVPDRHDLALYRLGEGPALVAVPKTHPLSSREALSLAELANEPIILLSHGEVPGSFEVKLRKVLGEQEFTPHISEVTPNLLLALNMVASGAGMALLPATVTGFRPDAISYLPLTDSPNLVVEFALYLRKKERARDLLALRDLTPGAQAAKAPADE